MDDFETQTADIKNRINLARQNTQYQAPKGRMAGRIYVAPNALEYLAAGLRSAGAGRDAQMATGELQDLQGKRREAETRDMSEVVSLLRGTPAQASTTTPTQMPTFDDADAATMQGVSGYGATTGAQAAKAGDPFAAYSRAAASQSPQIRQMGFQGMQQLPQLEANALDRKETRALREQEYKDKLEAQARLERERAQDRKDLEAQRAQDRVDAQQRQIQAQKDLQATLIANRPAPAPKPAGEGWKYDAGSDAWVKPPSAEFPMGQTTPNAGKAASLKNFDYLATNMTGEDDKGGTIAKTAQGGYFGLGGALGSGTQAAKEFDNTVEQMSTELRTVFRIPGEGALSDKEQAQYGIQLPKRGNEPDLNRKIIKDLRVRMNNRVNPQGVVAAQTPTGTTPIYASNGTQRIVSNDGGKTWQPAK